MRKIHFKIIVLVALFFGVTKIYGQDTYTPSKKNLEAREAFQDAKFGMFIHWGVYSVMGGGGEEGIAEWIMQNAEIKVAPYEKLPQFFNPLEFNAEEWVSMAKAAGMKYITITTKHHDGFAMYDSKISDYTIVKSTPFKRDILRELEQECKKQGIKLFAYYSQVDWHHPDYFPRGWTGRTTGRPEAGNWEKYLQYQNAQIKELATNYDISGFWFDGWWDQYPGNKFFYDKVDYRLSEDDVPDWDLERTYKMIHDVKSNLLIGNNHHVAPFQGEDFQMFEKDLPGETTTEFATAPEDIGELPFETCETINGSWGFNLIDNKHKSLDVLVKYIVNAAGRDTNFLLNVGPMPNGKIQKEHVQVLKELGEWMDVYSETIHGTRGGPVGVAKKYVTTQKGNRLFVHILDTSIKEMTLSLGKKVKRIERFDTNEEVKFKNSKKKSVTFTIPSKVTDIVTTLEIELKK